MSRTSTAVLAAGLTFAVAPGCTTCHHAAQEVSRSPEPAGLNGLPACQRDRVYVFLVSGNDPFGLGQLTGLRDRLNECGFAKVYCGRWLHGTAFEKEVRRIHSDDPDARFVVIGYSLGAAAADATAARLAADGVPLDGLVELAPVYLPLSPPVPVPAARRVVLVPHGADPAIAPGAEAIHVPGVGHFSLPTHPTAVRTVLETLEAAAARVPEYVPDGPSLPLLDSPAPIPFVVPTQGSKPSSPVEPIPPAPKRPIEGVLTSDPNGPNQ